jgi:hypothetical protein
MNILSLLFIAMGLAKNQVTKISILYPCASNCQQGKVFANTFKINFSDDQIVQTKGSINKSTLYAFASNCQQGKLKITEQDVRGKYFCDILMRRWIRRGGTFPFWQEI